MGEQPEKLTARSLSQMKKKGIPIAVTTAMDYVTSRLADAAQIDAVVVSDWSLATTTLGYASGLQLRWDEYLFYLGGVCRNIRHAVVIGSLPFGRYEGSNIQAVRSAAQLVKTGTDAVKLEGGGPVIERVRAISAAGILCISHLGACPQREKQRGGLYPYGTTGEEAAQVVNDALAMEEAGAWALLLDGIPDRVAEEICRHTKLITLGASGTAGCDGQVLAMHTILGMPELIPPLNGRSYACFEERMVKALHDWVTEVSEEKFPGPQQTFGIKDDQFALFLQGLPTLGRKGEPA